MKTVGRHYGFSTQCTALSTTCVAVSSVAIGGVPATINSWSDAQITLTVPSGVPNCAVQQQNQYQGTLPAGQSATAQCGQLVITAGNGKQSIATVTVTIGGKTPTHVSANQTIQSAIDAAAPGDMIIVDPTCTTPGTTTTSTCSASALHGTTATQAASAGVHNEMLIMWKPVRRCRVLARFLPLSMPVRFQPANCSIPGAGMSNCLFPASRCRVPRPLEITERPMPRTILPAPTAARMPAGIITQLRPRSVIRRSTGCPWRQRPDGMPPSMATSPNNCRNPR